MCCVLSSPRSNASTNCGRSNAEFLPLRHQAFLLEPPLRWQPRRSAAPLEKVFPPKPIPAQLYASAFAAIFRILEHVVAARYHCARSRRPRGDKGSEHVRYGGDSPEADGFVLTQSGYSAQ